jgi:divalent metal cation (Fe/Co/Zn/Cd) transporter
MQIGKRVALISILVSALLAVAKIVVGGLAGSTSVVADGLESAGDAIASGFVALASRIFLRGTLIALPGVPGTAISASFCRTPLTG